MLSGPWRVFSATAFGVLLSAVNTTMISVAMPSIVRHFSASSAHASWLLVAYMLSNTVMILVFGRLADVLSPVRLYRWGMWTLTVASLLCGLAPRVEVLIAMQFLQGVGAAAIVVTVVAILASRFPREGLGTALGWHTAAVSICQVIGPILGGVLIHLVDWRAAFWFNVPVGLLGLLWTYRVLPLRGERRERSSFDLLGALCYAATAGGLVLTLTSGGPRGWGHPVTVAGMAVAFLSLPLFVLSQRRARVPLIGRNVFHDARRNAGYLATFCISACRTAVILMIALFVQAATGAGPLEAGFQVFPLALGMAMAAGWTGFWARFVSLRTLTVGGSAVAAGGLFVMAGLLSPGLSQLVLSALLFLVGVGVGTFMGPNTTLIMRGAAPEERGVVNGIRSTLQNASYLTSSAAVLGVMVIGLESRDQEAAYAGTLSQASAGALNQLVTNCRYALLGIGALAAIAVLASALGGRPRSVAATRQ